MQTTHTRRIGWLLLAATAVGLVIGKLGAAEPDYRMVKKATDHLVLVLPSAITSAALSSEGRLIAVAHGDRIDCWDLESMTHKFSVDVGKRLVDMSFSPEARILAVARRVTGPLQETTSRIEMIDVKTGRQGRHIAVPEDYWILEVSFSPDGKQVLGILMHERELSRALRFWNSVTGESISPPEDLSTTRVSAVAFAPDRKRVAVGRDLGALSVWEYPDWKNEGELPGLNATICRLRFAPDGSQLAVFAPEYSARIVDMAANTSTQFPKLIASKIKDLAFYSSKRVFTADEDKLVRIWDVKPITEIARLKGHEESVRQVLYHPGAKHLISVGNDKTVRFWPIELMMEHLKVE